MNHKLSAVVAGAVLLTSIGISSAANAQLLLNDRTPVAQAVNSQDFIIPRGTQIAVQHPENQIFVAPSETTPLTLTVRNPVARNNRVILPAGAQIAGELQPVPDGTQFVARVVTLPNGQRYLIDARSGVVSRRETVQQNPRLGRVLAGTGIGAAAAAILAGLTGDRRIDAVEILSGAALGGAGSFATGRGRTDVIAVRPNTDLTLELRSDLFIR